MEHAIVISNRTNGICVKLTALNKLAQGGGGGDGRGGGGGDGRVYGA
ncbi:hypothetical protein T4A_3397 [Trichinella pseudospiralis]|uniref:Uncharacterized protein n=1 Tax=Trichinella pseudospiralis TaxID=6337 RepID=A0A0V1EB67_TRIPS|nr:hypothetical protein T4A_3397 [Trichinella pseudospiralis]